MIFSTAFKCAWAGLLLLLTFVIGFFIAKSIGLALRIPLHREGSGIALMGIVITTSVAALIETLFITMLVRGINGMRRQPAGRLRPTNK